jgi:hypothetical protein
MNITDYPLLVFALSFVTLLLSEFVGGSIFKRRGTREEGKQVNVDIILSGTLTLLGLIIGFSFSMAISRYDQRKTYEEAEANAIGTEYLRADLLPSADATKVRGLLADYLDQRVSFYTTRDGQLLRQIDSDTALMQDKLWSAVRAPALMQPTPVMALVVSGMNDVLNSQGYTQAAWWNRIPSAAWTLMAAIAVCCAVLVGYGARQVGAKATLLILPLVVAIAFCLIADLDSARAGLIRVHPQNLLSLLQSLHAH